MPAYPLAKAKDQLSRLVDEALAGQTVTITRHGKDVVELRPIAESARHADLVGLLAEIREKRKRRPSLGMDSVAAIRAMRDC